MNYNVELTADSVVKIGGSYRSSNKVTVIVKSAEDKKGVPVRVTVRVGCGSKESDLLASHNEWVKATCRQANGEPPNEMVPGGADTQTGGKEWDTGMFGISLPASICLEDFVSNTPPGAAEITITGRDAEGRQLFSEVRNIPKELEKSAEPAIVYFSVDPNYILHAGGTEVTVSFLATGFKTVALFRNNAEMQVWRAEIEGIDGGLKGDYRDRPSITSVYRIAAYKDAGVPHTEDRTVQIMSSGWNQVALAQGSPIRLFVANDFSDSSHERLYGIFRNDHDEYALYSSATGVDAWRQERGTVPHRMSTSPGVSYNNKLWLIGGSSVDPKNCSSEIWCYDGDGWRDRSDEKAPPWPERMGHACVVFPRMHDDKVEEEIWVFGGYNNGEVFRDLWRGRENDAGRLVWERIKPECRWPARLNHAAATVRNWDGEPQVWIYGGAQKPETPENLYDLWITQDGNEWKDPTVDKSDSVIVPAPGRPLGSALVASRTRGEEDRLFLIGSFREWAAGEGKALGNCISSFIFEWQWGHQVWLAQPVFDGWQQFQGDNFYMQALAFNRFLFVWSLKRRTKSGLKLNILVPH